MATITGGTFRFLKRVQVQQFEPQEADVTLHFTITEDEQSDEVLSAVVLEARARANQLLTGKVPETAKQEEPKAPKSAGQNRRSNDKNTSTSSPASDATSPAGEPNEKPGKPNTGAADPLADLGSSATPGSTSTAPADPTDLSDFEPAETTREIPDKEVFDACSRAARESGNPAAVKALITEYTLPPGTSKNIPQAKRVAFLAALAKLPKAAV